MARDLLVTEVATDLCCEVYRITQGFPDSERFGLTSQMQRCAVSVPSKLRIAVRLGYIRTSENELLSRTYQLLNALIRSLKANSAAYEQQSVRTTNND